MGSLALQWKANEIGGSVTLSDRETGALIPVPHWQARASEHTGLVTLINWLDDDVASENDTGVTVPHSHIAELDETRAEELSLPSVVPLILNLQHRGLLTDPAFTISESWLELATRPAFGIKRIGAFVSQGSKLYRVPEPLFSIASVAERLSAPVTDEGSRFRLLAELSELLPKERLAELQTSPFLGPTKIVYAAAFSLNLRSDADGLSFDPVLFGRKLVDEISERQPLASEAQGLLPPVLQEKFAKERFTAHPECQRRYAIDRGYYIYVDDSLQPALSAVRRAQLSGRAERASFARNPRAKLKELLGERFSEEAIERLFVETEQYSRRVVDIGLWQPPVIPWMKPIPNTWLPEAFGVRIGDEWVEIPADEVEPLAESLRTAIAQNAPDVPLGQHRIPATSQALDAVSRLVGLARPGTPADTLADPPDDRHEPKVESGGRYVLIIRDNYEEPDYEVTDQARSIRLSETLPPPGLRTSLKPHQNDGVSWFCRAWNQGAPGVLLADDMGLGKTLQTLTFLAWLRSGFEGLGIQTGPFLIVAPTGLLKNWENEYATHLMHGTLGDLCRAYGSSLKGMREAREKDVLTGKAAIDPERMKTSGWVLTTYETLSDYQHSFAVVRFPVIVFDEIQKIKNPATQITRAAKVMNSEFVIGLTGTPVENRLEDLWSIMDRVRPGYLRDLKTFSRTFSSDNPEALRSLNSRLTLDGPTKASIMLRRLKRDQLKGLPPKHEHHIHEMMTVAQADAYRQAIQEAMRGNGPTMLEALNRMRSISLHPFIPAGPEGAANRSAYIANSARLRLAFNVLDEIAAKGEKALIFLESREMQDFLAPAIQERYKLSALPMLINGSVAGPKRQPRVEKFQTSRGGFDVMILSPRAGGVGLTLTAANHVIHLSRWWNPAVEDQCTDRVYRIGQNQEVHVYYPMAIHSDYPANSFDLTLNALLQRKRALSLDLLAPPEASLDDLQRLLKDTIGGGATETASGLITLDDIDGMEPIQFENWVLEGMRRCTFEVRKTPRSHDGGADVIAIRRSPLLKVIVQCKHTQRNGLCDDEPIQDLLRARVQHHQADAFLAAVTNARAFSEPAKRLAQEHKVALVSRTRLSQWPLGCL